MFLSNGAIGYCQVSPGIARAQKNIWTIQFLIVISQYFTVLVADHQYRVPDQIVSESTCLKFSCHQTFNPYKQATKILLLNHELLCE